MTDRLTPEQMELVIQHLPLAKRVASSVRRKLSANTERDEIEQMGVMGLIDAVRKFDPAIQGRFETYAISRIRGAIFDELRSSDWAPRSLRRRTRLIESVTAAIEQDTGVRPDDATIARHTGLNARDVAITRAASTASQHVPYGDTDEDDDRDPSLASLDNVTSSASVSNTIANLLKAFDAMPLEDQQFLALYYYRGLTIQQVAVALGITASKASQTHTRLVLAIRQAAARDLRPY